MHADYPSADEAKVLDAAEALMRETMAKYDPSHDAFHVQRVRKTALALAAAHDAPRPDLLVVELAALLHDVLDKKYAPASATADPHAFLLPFFARVAPHVDLLADGRARAIARIVDNVSWSTEEARRAAGELTPWHATCAELHCVQDADRLDAIGAFGIMRCAAFSAATNRPLHAPADDPARAHTAVQHFHDKLLHVTDRLKTAPARRWAARRHQLMLDFLRAVDDEFDPAPGPQ